MIQLKKLLIFIINIKNYLKIHYPIKILQKNLQNKRCDKFVFNDEKFQKIHKDYKNSQILNMKMTDKLNDHLLKKIEIINKLKSDNPEYYSNIDYKLI